MTRSVKEWRGVTDNADIPPRVRLRIFELYSGICPKCSRKLVPGQWECDHIVALANGGEHREANLQPLCTSPCHSDKTRTDMAEKSASYARRLSHTGIKRKRSSFQTNRDGAFRKKISGEVIRR